MRSRTLTHASLRLATNLWLAIAGGCYRGFDAGAGSGSGPSGGGSAADGVDEQGGSEGDRTEGGESGGSEASGSPPSEDGVGFMGMRRLSRFEYDLTVRDLLGDDTRPASQRLPEDVVDPFDNDYTTQLVSSVLIEGLESLAIDVSTRLLADPPRRDVVVGCTPSGATDTSCMQHFVETFGRRALRRPLTTQEITELLELAQAFVARKADFYQGVDVVLRTLLQHPQFIYRIEIGMSTDEPGLYRLDDFEVATRLSYLLWGSTPDDQLLDLAEQHGLGVPEDVRSAAERLLEDPRARDRVDRFHALWLGYYTLPHAPELTTAMREESRALVEKLVFDDRSSWMGLFTAKGTFINDFLAEHYGLPQPGTNDFVWVDYGDSGRQGILSQGSFLALGSKFGDTSPTLRGIGIRTRLLCQPIPPPPPDVNVDEPPQSPASSCKWDRYAAHRDKGGSCHSCHSLTDPVGFGLEHYDAEGRYRVYEPDNPLTPEDETTCEIRADGVIDGSTFRGPAELADFLVAGQQLDDCVVAQVYRFAMGHHEQEHDIRYLEDLALSFRDTEHRFDRLMLDLAGDEAFLYRREELGP